MKDGGATRETRCRGRSPRPTAAGVGRGRESEGLVLCARQRTGQEGSSPSGPRMRGAVSKGGGNASPAAGGRYGDTYTGTQAKAGHSQGGPGAPTTELRRTGRPSRGGVRRVCGAVPGRSRGGDPMTNRSAKGGARSSLHYGGEGALIHPPHQGVCGRHGTEDQCVTLGDLGGSAGGTAATDPISESKWEGTLVEESDGRVAPDAWRKRRDRASGNRVGWGRRPAKTVGTGQTVR